MAQEPQAIFDWAVKKKSLNEALTQVKHPRFMRPSCLALLGFPPRPGVPGLSKLKRNSCVCSSQFRADQHCRDELGLGSNPLSRSQRSLSAYTQRGTPRVEVILHYLYQLLLSITHHQLFDMTDNENPDSELNWKFLISTTWELLLKWVTKLPFYLYLSIVM